MLPDLIVNRTNPIYKSAMNFIANGNGLSTIQFSSREMKEDFEALEKEDDSYFQKLMESAKCFATTSQYLCALYNKSINSLKRLVLVAMIDSGYDRELLPHSLNLLKESWILGDRLDD